MSMSVVLQNTDWVLALQNKTHSMTMRKPLLHHIPQKVNCHGGSSARCCSVLQHTAESETEKRRKYVHE